MGNDMNTILIAIPRRKMVTFVVNDHEYGLLVMLAKAENRNVSETLREMVREAAERRGLLNGERVPA
jgi:DUF917 family protein